MHKFKDTLRIIEEGLLKPMSDAEVKQINIEKINELIKEILADEKTIKNPDGSIDYNGNFTFFNFDSGVDIKFSQLPIKFNKINGSFFCNNMGLTTLVGCPTYVDGDFLCSYNKITNLDGGPRYVKNDYNCSHNSKLTSFEGMNISNTSKLDINANSCNLTSLKGLPETVYSLIITRNKLKDFKYCPSIIRESIIADNNELTSLVGLPKEIGWNLEVSLNQLTDLIGAPEKINGIFSVVSNKLTSLKGSPKYIGLEFNCSGNIDLKSFEFGPKEVKEYVVQHMTDSGYSLGKSKIDPNSIKKYTNVTGSVHV